ncbi:MAG: C4-dicarboxylate TRAP transporter substrate-binding protein [Burkholderiaceae bacterium]|nr:C4-dicarboxylate TRAP transporter substrate-binding protein [Burkholderiaceae bacterium]
MKKLLFTAVSALAFASAHADTYQATNWLGPAHVLNNVAYGTFAADVKQVTGGDIDFEIFSSGSLVPAQTTLGAVGDGVAQLGIVSASYTPSDLPLSGMINDLAFVATDGMATGFAITEISMTNQRLLDELAKHNTVTVGAYSTPPYLFLCMRTLGDLDSLKGVKIRTAGTAQNEWAASLGAIPVAVPITDVYSGLERGSIDCTLSEATNLSSGYKFWEVAKTITMLEQGATLGLTYVYNKDFWKEIGAQNRRKLLDVTARNVVRTQIVYAQEAESALQGSKERGVSIDQPDPTLVDALDKFRANVIATYPGRTEKERRVADPTEVANEFLALQAKWTKLLDQVDRQNEDVVTQLVMDEIYSKIDENGYGL